MLTGNILKRFKPFPGGIIISIRDSGSCRRLTNPKCSNATFGVQPSNSTSECFRALRGCCGWGEATKVWRPGDQKYLQAIKWRSGSPRHWGRNIQHKKHVHVKGKVYLPRQHRQQVDTEQCGPSTSCVRHPHVRTPVRTRLRHPGIRRLK
jgi:hypothetical protein